MALLTQPQLSSARDLIFREGRLLERQLYRYFFEQGDRESCLKALLAYQNADGGFGNGLEPDLLCPGSSAIGAETALFILDMLDSQEPAVILPLLDWLTGHQDEVGGMKHPPPGLEQYPHQPWWSGGDEARVLVLAGQLSTWQETKPTFFAKARQFYEQSSEPEDVSFYSYPRFAYLSRLQQSEADQQAFSSLLDNLPSVLQASADHFPLFSRYWYYASDYVETGVRDAAAEALAAACLPAGGLPNPYPDLPWWKSIFTLDSLMLLQQGGYL